MELQLPTPPREATLPVLWSYLYQLTEQLNACLQTITAPTTGQTAEGSSAQRFSTLALNRIHAAEQTVQTLQTALAGKAPDEHAAADTRHGAASAQQYGHVRLSDATDGTATADNATAATPAAVATACRSAQSAQQTATAAASSAQSALSAAAAAQEAAQEAADEAQARAPVNHAAADTDYGVGGVSKYGHVRLSASTSSTLGAADGTAAAPSAVKAAYDLANGKAPKAHASSATTYGTGSGSNYGHVRLSAATDGTEGISGGTAATPSAVKAAYDLASRAVTTLLGDRKLVCGWSDVSFISTKDLNTTIDFGVTFSARPVVLISQPFNSVVCTAFDSNVTTTSFIVNVPKVGSTTQSTRKMAWLAIGPA